MMARRIFIAAVAAGGIAVAGASPAFAIAEIASHRAIYDLTLGSKDSSSQIVAIAGKSQYRIESECDGWKIAEDYAIWFGSDGGRLGLFSQSDIWERRDGTFFAFTLREKDTENGETNIEGFAEKSADGIVSASIIDGDETLGIKLPQGTAFPVAHTRMLLADAEAAVKTNSAVIFDGGEAEDSLHQVHSFIGSYHEEESAFELGALAEKGYWQVRQAYFDPASREAVPKFEAEFAMQPNGIVRFFVFEYGDFSMNGVLSEIEALDSRKCDAP